MKKEGRIFRKLTGLLGSFGFLLEVFGEDINIAIPPPFAFRFDVSRSS